MEKLTESEIYIIDSLFERKQIEWEDKEPTRVTVRLA